LTLPPLTVCPADVPVVNPSVNTANNRLNGYLYDAAGNTVRDAENRRFTYDGENKQVKVEMLDANGNPIATISEYFYDGDGKRVKKFVPSTGETTIFVYDASGKMLAEYSTQVAQPSEAKVSYLTTDHLGSPRILTDANGQLISRRDFYPFGEEIFTAQRTQGLGYTADSVRQKFTSYERDVEIDLDFAQARYYNSKHGRFTTVDPLMASARTIRPESWNRYVYCWNNPIALVDSDGKDVKFLDEKSKESVLSTLPEELRIKVEKQIDKNGLLKKGALDKIKSKDTNFLALKAAVNEKGTLEVITASKDPRNNEAFFYKTDAEERKELVEALIKTGSTPEEANKEADELMSDPNRVRSMGLGVTLAPGDKGNPGNNFRVVLSDGTGDASDAPQVDLAAATAHEIYGHGLPGMQGKPWKHEFTDPPGHVDTNIKNIEKRTRDLYKKP
jgi:RHS repeat-associated protein